MPIHYLIDTYGCQMNEYDSALIASLLEKNGCVPTEDPEEAELFFFNTCSVREKAEESAKARISKMKFYKKRRPWIKFIVTGCMAEHLGVRLMEQVDCVDYVIGPDKYNQIPALLFPRPLAVNKKTLLRRVVTGFEYSENYLGEYAKLSHPFSSYVTIQRGCNFRCSYCIVPFVRGREKYRAASDVIREVEAARDNGISEICLLGQTVNAYRENGMDFADLLIKISEIQGIRRIRFMSPHPRFYTEKLIDVLQSVPQICPHAHIPIQSGSDTMLQKMRRRYTVNEFMRILEKFRGNNPLYGLTTDVIAGFVGETEEDFKATLDAFQEAQFDAAFMFIYSPREGTDSAKEAESLTEEQKQERLARLVDLQNAITLKRNQQMIGRTEEILVEGPSSKNPNEWVGKTGSFKKVVFASENVKPGDYVQCHIDDIRGWTLRGTVV